MPLYEYECSACGHRFERIQKFSDPPEKTCPKCGGEVHKLISSPAVQFKGTGWYVTDYAGKGKESKETKETKGKETSDASKDTGKDTKSESTAKDSKTESTTKDTKATKDA